MMAGTNRRKTTTTIASLGGYSNHNRRRPGNKNQPNGRPSFWKSWIAKAFLFLSLGGSVVFYVRLVRHGLQNSRANIQTSTTATTPPTPITSAPTATPTSAPEIEIPPPYPNSDLPLWIQDYILWHGQQRAALNATNWQDTIIPDDNNGDNENNNKHNSNKPSRHRFQFLVVRCLANDQKCGGTADRLRPLPLYVWIAAHLNRILLIQWERPCALQEFLVPPDVNTETNPGNVSVDWTWPDFFPSDTKLMFFSEHAELEVMQNILPYVDTDWTTKKGKEERQTDPQERTPEEQEEHGPTPRRSRNPEDLPQFISMLYQSAGHGANFYNEHRYHHYKSDDSNGSPNDEPDHDHVFKPLWKAFFTPSPAVQALLDREREALQLTTDHYVAVHIRSQYHNYLSDLQIRTLVRHAMNCGSQLQLKLKQLSVDANNTPDSAEPIFVATDSSRAATAVAAYGKRRNAHYFRQRESTLAESDSASSASEPLHLDRGSAHLNRNASVWTTAQDPADYYDTFVDLYLLAGSRCITYHVGGYGRWANLLSSNLTCEMNHLKNKCSWTEPTMDTVGDGI
jgi:hypothetical protein